MPKNWHQRDAYIYGHAKPNPPGNSAEHRVMDVLQVDEKAGKKQEMGKMEEGG